MKKQIVITRMLEFGGNNTYLKTLIEYFGKKNLIIIVRSKEEFLHVKKLDDADELYVKVIPRLRNSLDYKRYSFIYNLKELLLGSLSLLFIFCLSARYRFAGISVSVIEPETYLYLFWLPFIKVTYILHSEPRILSNPLTPITCNARLGAKKVIITVSYSNRNSILAKWKIRDRKAGYVYVVYNCVAENKKIQDDLSISKEAPVILTMGHVVEYKNPYLWLDVAKRVTALRPNVIFYWLGNGALLDSFREQTKQDDKIRFTGLVENIYPFLKRATIYYQPSLSETQGLGVIEAMSNHVPCVVSGVGGLPESVEHNINGFVVDAGDVGENVDRIVELLDDAEKRKSFGQNSYKKYRELFTYDIFKRGMDKIYA